jgi:hypothetical protein
MDIDANAIWITCNSQNDRQRCTKTTRSGGELSELLIKTLKETIGIGIVIVVRKRSVSTRATDPLNAARSTERLWLVRSEPHLDSHPACAIASPSS